MKASPWCFPTRISVSKGIVLFGVVLALSIYSASAGLVIDLRIGAISGAGSIVDEKSVFGVDVGSIVTLQVWAEITPDAAPVNNIYGIQVLLGSIVTASSPATGGNVRGDMSPAMIHAPFNAASVAGVVAELSVPADGSLDLGSSSTTSSNGMIKFRSDPTIGEVVVSNSTGYVTNNVPRGATVNPLVGGGYEFLLGTADFTVNTVLDELDPALSVNWAIPAFTTAALKGSRAIWTDGDGMNNNGNGQGSDMSVGEAVEISATQAIPEPGAFATLIAGLATLLTFRPNRSRAECIFCRKS
jgi:hypothetical protein